MRMKRLEIDSGLELFWLTEATALYRHRQMHPDYWVAVCLTPDGRVAVTGATATNWNGPAPARAREIMAERDSEALQCSVTTDKTGVSRCWATAGLSSPDELTGGRLYDLAACILDVIHSFDRIMQDTV